MAGRARTARGGAAGATGRWGGGAWHRAVEQSEVETIGVHFRARVHFRAAARAVRRERRARRGDGARRRGGRRRPREETVARRARAPPRRRRVPRARLHPTGGRTPRALRARAPPPRGARQRRRGPRPWRSARAAPRRRGGCGRRGARRGEGSACSRSRRRATRGDDASTQCRTTRAAAPRGRRATPASSAAVEPAPAGGADLEDRADGGVGREAAQGRAELVVEDLSGDQPAELLAAARAREREVEQLLEEQQRRREPGRRAVRRLEEPHGLDRVALGTERDAEGEGSRVRRQPQESGAHGPNDLLNLRRVPDLAAVRYSFPGCTRLLQQRQARLQVRLCHIPARCSHRPRAGAQRLATHRIAESHKAQQ